MFLPYNNFHRRYNVPSGPSVKIPTDHVRRQRALQGVPMRSACDGADFHELCIFCGPIMEHNVQKLSNFICR